MAERGKPSDNVLRAQRLLVAGLVGGHVDQVVGIQRVEVAHGVAGVACRAGQVGADARMCKLGVRQQDEDAGHGGGSF